MELDHATVNRLVVKYSPLLELKFRRHKKKVGSSWRMDETYIKIKSCLVYYYRAVYTDNQKDRRWVDANEGDQALKKVGLTVWNDLHPERPYSPPKDADKFGSTGGLG